MNAKTGHTLLKSRKTFGRRTKLLSLSEQRVDLGGTAPSQVFGSCSSTIENRAALLALVFVAYLACQPSSLAQNNRNAYPPDIPGARTEVYKTVGDVKLNIHIFEPKGLKSGDQRPAVVFYFGGGWRSGNPKQFEHQSKYLASRGLVAFSADYRVLSRHQTPAVKCVADGKSAIRWIRQNAHRLGIDPSRIVAGGGSAGGHVAAAAGVIPGLEEIGEDFSVSSKPNAMVLFNPALVLASVPGIRQIMPDRLAELEKRMGVKPDQLSPYHHIVTGLPPTLIFHGNADTTVPFETADVFAKAMQKANNRCELAAFEGQAHGFFNFGRGKNEAFRETVNGMDEFLQSLGYLKGGESVDEYLDALK